MELATLIQPGHTWIDVVLSLILMAPGIIAAASSLRNGKHLKNLTGENHVTGDKSLKKKARAGNGDWWSPPDV